MLYCFVVFAFSRGVPDGPDEVKNGPPDSSDSLSWSYSFPPESPRSSLSRLLESPEKHFHVDDVGGKAELVEIRPVNTKSQGTRR